MKPKSKISVMKKLVHCRQSRGKFNCDGT